jgi:hypothetical protein
MDSMTALALLAEHLTARGLSVTKQHGTSSPTTTLHVRVAETVTTGGDCYLTDCGYEIGQHGDEPPTAGRVTFLLGLPRAHRIPVTSTAWAERQPETVR